MEAAEEFKQLIFAGQGPEIYAKMFEEKPEQEDVYFPESPAEFQSMLRQMQAEGALPD